MRVSRICVLLAVTLAAPPFVLADFSYQQTTQITGGSLLSMIKMAGVFSSQARKAGDPISSSVYLKGNRMARVDPQTIEIIDLDKETITNIDLEKHAYTTMTFEQMKEQMAEAEREMEKKQAQQPASSQGTPSDVQMSFDVHVRNTGASKQVGDLDANEAIMTMMMNATDPKTAQSGAMAITNDMWLAPEVPGYDEMRDFSMRMAQKMGSIFTGSGFDMSRLLGQQPGANQALQDMAKEMAKIKGVPVLQVMRMGTTTNGQPLPAASEAPLPANPSPATPSAGEVAKQGAASAITNRLGGFGGGFGGFGHKKKEPAPSEDQTAPAGQTPPPTSAVLLESKTESSNFSSAPVDESHFEIPQGYKEVQFKMRHGN